jgi:hypothetical protein
MVVSPEMMVELVVANLVSHGGLVGAWHKERKQIAFLSSCRKRGSR